MFRLEELFKHKAIIASPILLVMCITKGLQVNPFYDLPLFFAINLAIIIGYWFGRKAIVADEFFYTLCLLSIFILVIVLFIRDFNHSFNALIWMD